MRKTLYGTAETGEPGAETVVRADANAYNAPLSSMSTGLVMKFSALLLTLILAGCSTYSFHTNLDKENFTEYFKPGTVTLVDK